MAIQFGTGRAFLVEEPYYTLLDVGQTWIIQLSPAYSAENQYVLTGESGSALVNNRYIMAHASINRGDVTFGASAHNTGTTVLLNNYPDVLFATTCFDDSGNKRFQSYVIPLNTQALIGTGGPTTTTGNALGHPSGYGIGARPAKLTGENVKGQISFVTRLGLALTQADLIDLATGKTTLLETYKNDIDHLFDFSVNKETYTCPYSGHVAIKTGGDEASNWFVAKKEPIPLSRAPSVSATLVPTAYNKPMSFHTKALFPTMEYVDNGVYTMTGTLPAGLSFSNGTISGTPTIGGEVGQVVVTLNGESSVTVNIVIVRERIKIDNDAVATLSTDLLGKKLQFNDFLRIYLEMYYHSSPTIVSDHLMNYLRLLGYKNT